MPPSQGWSHFRAVQQLGKTPVRFTLFPGEPHGLRKLVHQRRKVEEELAWFDGYLWGHPSAENLALAANSPLARMIELSKVARDGPACGVRISKVLVPEGVDAGGFEVGRFEVTDSPLQ